MFLTLLVCAIHPPMSLFSYFSIFLFCCMIEVFFTPRFGKYALSFKHYCWLPLGPQIKNLSLHILIYQRPKKIYQVTPYYNR